MENKETYICSTNGEDFNSETYGTKKEAIQYYPEEVDLDKEVGEEFYVGIKREFFLGGVDPDSYLEMAFGEHEDTLNPDYSSSWTEDVESSQEVKDFIEKKSNEIGAFIMEKFKPTFYSVDNVTSHNAGD